MFSAFCLDTSKSKGLSNGDIKNTSIKIFVILFIRKIEIIFTEFVIDETCDVSLSGLCVLTMFDMFFFLEATNQKELLQFAKKAFFALTR